MANTEWWQRGPVDGIPALMQPVAHILLQVRESTGDTLVTSDPHGPCTVGASRITPITLTPS